jgi:hypothetical protein
MPDAGNSDTGDAALKIRVRMAQGRLDKKCLLGKRKASARVLETVFMYPVLTSRAVSVK